MTRSKKRYWNVAFLVRDYPQDMGTIGPTHFNGRIGEDFLTPLRELAKREFLILSFVGHYTANRFLWFGFRVKAKAKLDALEEARHRLDGLVDGASFFNDNNLPKISNFAWIGTARASDLQLVSYNQQIWLEMANGSPESRAMWEKRNKELKLRINRFFSLAIEWHSKAKTPLAKQIRHSMRMFRYGKQSGSWGVEFICKFCALEGLVCGEEQYNKEKKLISRLVALFRDRRKKFEKQITRLWAYRNKAVHTAKAFDAGSLDEGAPLGVHIERIEHLFVGALVFALERVSNAENVSEMWAAVSTYKLPEFARQPRPKDFPRYAAPNMEGAMGVSWSGGGRLFRKHLADGRLKYDAANPREPAGGKKD